MHWQRTIVVAVEQGVEDVAGEQLSDLVGRAGGNVAQCPSSLKISLFYV